MVRGIKKPEGLELPPKEYRHLEAENKPVPEILRSPEIDLERVKDPEYAGELLDEQAAELETRLKMLRIQLDNGLIDREKYQDLKEQIDAATVDFIKKLERAEKEFKTDLPPGDSRLAHKTFMEAQMEYLAKKEALLGAKRLFDRGEMPEEEYQKHVENAVQASAQRDLALADIPDEMRGLVEQIMDIGEKELRKTDTLAPEGIAAAPAALEEEGTKEKEPGLFDQVQSFDDLDALIRAQGKPGSATDKEGKPKTPNVWVTFGDMPYTVEELRGMITDIRDGHIPTQSLTRNEGLRAKVEELLAKEQQEKVSAAQATGAEPEKEVQAPAFEYKTGDWVVYMNEEWRVEQVGGKLADIYRVVKNAKGEDTLERRIVDTGELSLVTGPRVPDVGKVELQRPGPAPDAIGEVPLRGAGVPTGLDDIDAQLRRAKETYRPMETAYWEQQKAEYLERAKAESAALRLDATYEELRGAYSELTSADLDPARRKELHSRVAELEKERDKLTGRTWGDKFKKAVRAGYDGALAGLAAAGAFAGEKLVAGAEYAGRKVLSAAEWIKVKAKKHLPKYAERLLTSVTFGWWDFHQAEKFRSATKGTAEDIRELARAIREEEHLSEEEALREAEAMRKLLARPGSAAEGGLKASDYEAASLAVSEQKRAENKKKEDEIVGYALGQLTYKLETSSWFMKYRTTRKGQEVMSPETTAALEQRIREKLRTMRNGQTAKDTADYKKLLRESLDPHWWNRYIYGGIALALNSIGLAYHLAPGAAEAAASKAAETAGAGAAAQGAGAEAAKQVAEVALRDTIWAEAKRQLVAQGIERPTDVMIQDVASEIAKESGVKVVSKAGEVIWQETAQGQFIDRALQKGFMLKLGAAMEKIAALKGAVAAGGLPAAEAAAQASVAATQAATAGSGGILNAIVSAIPGSVLAGSKIGAAAGAIGGSVGGAARGIRKGARGVITGAAKGALRGVLFGGIVGGAAGGIVPGAAGTEFGRGLTAGGAGAGAGISEAKEK